MHFELLVFICIEEVPVGGHHCRSFTVLIEVCVNFCMHCDVYRRRLRRIQFNTEVRD